MDWQRFTKRGKGLIDLKKAFYEFPYKQYPFRFDKYFASKVTNEIVVTSLETGKAEFLTEKSDEKDYLTLVLHQVHYLSFQKQ